VDASGNRRVFPNNTATYTLTAVGPGGRATRSATVTVSAPAPAPPPPTAAKPSIDDRMQRDGLAEPGLHRRVEFPRVGRVATHAPHDMDHHERGHRESVKRDGEDVYLWHGIDSVSIAGIRADRRMEFSGNASTMQQHPAARAALLDTAAAMSRMVRP